MDQVVAGTKVKGFIRLIFIEPSKYSFLATEKIGTFAVTIYSRTYPLSPEMLEFSDLEPIPKNPPKPWTKIFLKEQVIINMIILNSIVLFLLGFPNLHMLVWLEVVDLFFTVYFIMEAVVKMYSYGAKTYFKNSWNRFDFLLVIISLPSLVEVAHIFPDISYLLVFRLLRLLRLLRRGFIKVSIDLITVEQLRKRNRGSFLL